MSAKSSKKSTATKAKSAIVTRNKTAQNRSQRLAKNKKTLKSTITKDVTKPETKSTNTSSETSVKDTPLQSKVRQFFQYIEQVEYYPDKLKRDVFQKKVFLKHKHNFKVIARTNKRKMAVPQKGGLEEVTNCPDIRISRDQVVNMLDLIEETQNLSDEDFMEILTCPSPVWWENPPSEEYFEEAICTRRPSPSSISEQSQVNIKPEEQQTNSTDTTLQNTTDLKNKKGQFNKIPINIFKNKKLKLESLLCTIKNDKQNNIDNNLNTAFTVNTHEKYKNAGNKSGNKGNKKTRTSESRNNKSVNRGKINTAKGNTANKNENKIKIKTENVTENNSEGIGKIKTGKGEMKNDEEDLSDLSFNEEELLSNLENMDIPIEQNKSQNEQKILSQRTETRKNINIEINDLKAVNKKNNNEVIVPDRLPPLKRKPDLKNVKKNKLDSTNSNLEYSEDSVTHSNFKFITDDSTESECNIAKKMKIVNISPSVGECSSLIDVDLKNDSMQKEQTDNKINKSTQKNDLSEYITVYKIMSNGSENEISNKSNDKIDHGRKKINNFYKTCKVNKRSKKSNGTFPAISVKNIKDLVKENNDSQKCVTNLKKENSDVNDDIRLKSCDCQETESGSKTFSCEKCERTRIFTCNCSFLAYSKEIFMIHASNCKDVGRIPWKNNRIVSQM